MRTNRQHRKKTGVQSVSNERDPRQIPGFPAPVQGMTTIMFPKGNVFEAYIPYTVTVCLPPPEKKLINLILVKRIEAELKKVLAFHELAVAQLTEARNEIWRDWEIFRKNLEDNKENISNAIFLSRKLASTIAQKSFWKAYPVCKNESNSKDKFYPPPPELKFLNIGRYATSDEICPKDFLFPKNTKVVDLVVKYVKKNFNTIYNMKDISSDNYWQFVTKYTRTYCISIEQINWNTPESWENNSSGNLPPATF